IDGRILPDDIGVVFERGQQQPVPFMVGSADWEDSLLGRASIPPRVILAPVLGELDVLRAAYDGADDETLAHGWFRDGAFIAPSRLLADRMARVGQPGYVYLFSYVAEGQRGRVPGAAHCSETPFVFGNFIERSFRGVDFRYSDADRAFGEKVSAAWRSFARDGKPVLPGTPAWPAFAFGDADVMMRLDAPPVLERRYRPAVMDYYRRRTEGLLARQKD
ncbi:MAG TPA: carboxylesterase family protein, partial [Rubrivivax sp.]|nr:carboxylesterase family protein [Rubrivivax sp.]